MTKVLGLGPHGERAAPPERVMLLPEDIARAKSLDARVAIVMHTTISDWARLLLQGIIGTLGEGGITVVEVVDCEFDADTQNKALDRLRGKRVDCIISLPVANASVAQAHRRVANSSVKLILIDNVPTGLTPGIDYSCLISADNFGLGCTAAELLSSSMQTDGTAIVVGYDSDFFATNQREVAFKRWMSKERPDLLIDTARFKKLSEVQCLAGRIAERQVRPDGVFVVWDTPCVELIGVLKKNGLRIPVTTVDLGEKVATELAIGGFVCGVAAQKPFAQGQAVAWTVITDLLGRPCPDWIALPGVPVMRENVVQHYQMIWRTSAPKEILRGSG